MVIGSDGVYYRSLANGNQNNNPTTTSGFWTLLYSVEWNAGITYQVGAVVTYDGEQYQSLQGSNLNQNPSTASSYWVLLSFAWLATATYSEDQNAVGTDGILYTSLQDSNTGNDPATSPAYWVGTSAAAAASATAAAASATAAAASETAAETAETNAETAQAAAEAAQAAAETAETNAETAETNAASSATAAAGSATAAATSATNAATSATNSASSATASAASATAALASETAAAASETAAAASESAAATSETNAANSATAAATSATNSANSATASASSATDSANSASAASTSASNAATSASNAATSATASAASAVAAAASYDAFDDRYLGDKASDPTVDNDGNALLTGALYFNTTSDVMKVYDGSAWNIAAISSASPTFTGTVTADGLSLGDNDKATFGAGNDLEIYHDGSNSFITDVGTGNLNIRASNILRLQSASEEKYLEATADGSVTLYNNNNAKLATTNTGIDVTGTATMDGLTVDGSITTTTANVALDVVEGTSGSDAIIGIVADGSGRSQLRSTNGLGNASDFRILTRDSGGTTSEAAKFHSNGDISFYEDTGTTPKFFWDASAEALGIGTAPDAATVLHVQATEPQVLITDASIPLQRFMAFDVGLAADEDTHFITVDQADALAFGEKLNGNDRVIENEWMRITNAGNVGIGTASPAAIIHSYQGASGQASINAFANGLVIEDNASNGISILTPSTAIGSIFFGDEADNFIGGLRYDHSDNSLATYVNNAERLRIDASGKVGIGTSSPQAKLDVSGVGNFSTDWDNFSGDGLHIQCSGTGGEGAYTGGISFSRISTDNNSRAAGIAGVEGTDADRVGLAFFIHQSATTSNSLLEAMRIDYSGNVGIGTASPNISGFTGYTVTSIQGSNGAVLELADSTYVNAIWSADDNLTFDADRTNAGADSYMRFRVDTAEAMRIDSSGNVNIGAETPAFSGNLTVTESATSGTDHFLQRWITQSGGVFSIACSDLSLANPVWQIRSGTSEAIAFNQASSERMRIDTSGNLLVGTTDSNVAGNSGAANAGINIQTGGIKGVISAAAAQVVTYLNRLGTDGDIAVFRKDGTTVGSIGAQGGNLFLENGTVGLLFNNTTEELRPAGSGGVPNDGVVTLGSSAKRFKDLHLSSTANVGSVNIDQNNAFTNTNITSANTNTDKGNFIRFMQVASGSIPAPDFSIGHAGDNSGDAVLLNASSSSMKFYTNNTEKARITANGELLVGKTVADFNGIGAEILTSGAIRTSVDSNYTMMLNRKTDDGEILNFRKDGTTVGSIGTNSNIYLAGTSSGLRIRANDIIPVNATGAGNDNAVDLGIASQRWKDLYLSGGVYLGGTGAANKLDDYETGTWTPVISDAVTGGNAGSSTSLLGVYTKVGNIVTVTLRAINITTTGMTAGNDIAIQGLPFTLNGQFNFVGTITTGEVAFNGQLTVYGSGGGAYAKICDSVSATAIDFTRVSDLTSGNADFQAVFTYQVS